jgi:hypothetical protein
MFSPVGESRLGRCGRVAVRIQLARRGRVRFHAAVRSANIDSSVRCPRAALA